MTKSPCPIPLPVFVNRAGGAAARAGRDLPGQIRAAFQMAGTDVEVKVLDAEKVAPAVAKAARAHKRIVVAGGDGTMACAASVLAGTDSELALLPLGTLNHLARDLGIPFDLKTAAAIAANDKAASIDVGTVNGHRFVNNASIGLYPSMVVAREAVRDAHGLPKWIASMPASAHVLQRFRHHRLRVDMGDGERPMVTPLLFIGNNGYSLEPGSLGARTTLDDGRLSVYAVARRSRAGLIWFAMRVLAGKIDRGKDFVALGETDALTVRTPGRPVRIALDGEVLHLASPLEFAIERRALNVVVPS